MNNPVGDEIAKVRTEKGMSAAELARRAGVTRGFISLLEKGATGVSLEKLTLIANALGVEVETLRKCQKVEELHKPDWLQFLDERYRLTDDDCRELVKIVNRVGIIDHLPEESLKEFKERWDAFYQKVVIFLPNSSVKILSHPEVKPFVELLGIDVNPRVTWRQVMAAFDVLVDARIGVDVEVKDGREWLRFVWTKLGIKLDEITLDKYDTSEFAERLTAIRALVESSRRVYGVVVKGEESGVFVHIPQKGAPIIPRGDFPMWHEAVRVLVDPGLRLNSLKSGMFYYPDGEDRPPLEFVICRLAARLACRVFKKVFQGTDGEIAPKEIEDLVSRVYPEGLPWRVAFVGLLDYCDAPYVYVDCYKRLKRKELKEKKIRIEDTQTMSNDKDAKLRIGFVFRNLAAEETSFELRHNLRVSDKSVIMQAFELEKDGAELNDKEDFSTWGEDYDLDGRADVLALRQLDTVGMAHVRAIVKVLQNKEGGRHE